MIRKVKEIAKQLPVIPAVYAALYSRCALIRLRLKSVERVFTDIYTQKSWGGKDSVSGTGSGIDQTRIILQELPGLLADLEVSTMLDIPCGDFNWMKGVDLGRIDYTGADIVSDLIKTNNDRFGADGTRFERLNLIRDKLPQVDLIFCRDCFVHFSNADIFRALENICNSRAGYLLTTTFTGRRQNHDIVTGRWHPVNLERAPFLLPAPLRIINEGCTQGDGAYADKALGLWRTIDIREELRRRPTGRQFRCAPFRG